MGIKLVSLFADRLNLNGDQANLLVLQKRLKWAGLQADIVAVSSADELKSAAGDFLFLGHGSLAAWAACRSDWPSIAEDFLLESGRAPAMSVASASDLLLPRVSDLKLEHEKQTSEFVVETLGSIRILGYKNTRQVHSESKQIGNLLLTWLHGPVLAKNPKLADAIIARILGTEGFELKENDKTRKIEQIVAGVWQLEAE